MELGLKDKVVVITGGSKGIGLACAQAFLAEGARVAIVSRSRSNLDSAASVLPGVVCIAGDLIQATAAKEMVRQAESALGAIDVLVNSAGAARRYLPEDLNAEAWHAAMDAKYFTYIHAMDAVLPGMAGRGSGTVVNIIGMGGKVATPIHLPGGAANSALMLATVGLAQRVRPEGCTHQCDQSRRDHDRARERSAEAGGQEPVARAKTRCSRRDRPKCRCAATRPRRTSPT